MDKNILTILLLGLFMISFASALEFDNVKSYNPITREVTITNAFGFGEVIGEARLNTLLNVNVARGYQKVAEFQITAYQDYNDALKQFSFTDMKNKKKINRDYDLKYLTYEDVLVDDYNLYCYNTTSENGSIDYEKCENILIGSHYEQREIWTKITPANLKKDDVLTIGVFTEVQEGDYVDWIPIIYGVEVEEWATWTEDLNVGILSYYKLDEQDVSESGIIIDAVGTNNGTNVGGVNTSGIINTAYNFIGYSNDRINTNFKPTSTNVTYSTWVYLTQTSTGIAWRILSNEDTNTGFSVTVHSSGGVLSIKKGTGTGTGEVYSNYVLTNNANKWVNIITVWDGTNVIIYINGTQDSSQALPGAIVWGAKNLLIGNRPTSFDRGFAGRIDEVAVWGRALSPSEALKVFEAGRDGSSYTTLFAPTIILNSPSSTNYTTLQNITINLTAYDNMNLTDVKLYVNDVLNQTNATGVNNSNYIFPLNLGDGDYTIYGKATDNESGETNSDSIRIVVNTTPFIEFVSPTTENGTNLTIDYIPINISLTEDYFANLTLDFYFNDVLNESLVLTNSTRFYNKTGCLSGNWKVNATVWTTTGNMNVTKTRSFNIDVILPTIDIEAPTILIPYNYVGNNETLNVTFTDTSLESCWYDYNGTNITIEGCLTGVKNSTTFILEEGNYNMTLYANDSISNLNSTFINWTYNIFELNITYNEEVLDLSIEDFILYVQSTEEITESKMNYNGTDYSSNILSLGSDIYKITNTIQIPDTDADTNYTFYFNITTPTNTIITQSHNQTVFLLLIDNCDSYTNTIFNITLYDEKTLSDLFGTIEVNLELFNNDKKTALTNAVSNFYNMSEMAICTNVNLTGTGYYYDLEVRYYVDPTNTSSFVYVPEFYHIQKASVENLPQLLKLYNLHSNQSTEFTMYYRDNDYTARPNVLLQIQRKYVSEGIFRTVEIPITSNEGSALGHFDLDNYKYKIIATYNGEVLNIFDNPAIVCESELSGLCTLTLNGQGSSDAFEDYETIIDTSYNLISNGTIITYSFTIPSGETKHVRVVMVQSSPFQDDVTICNTSLTSSAGTIECTASSTIGDSNVLIKVFLDDVLVVRANVYYQEDLGDFFLLNNYAIASLFLIMLITMMVSSPVIMVATSIFSVALLGLVFLIKGSSIGLNLGAFSWLLIAGILILVKLNKKDET